MEFERIEKTYDFVVVGGGFTGVCTAIQASREGLKTALITNRGFIGGNSGCEVRCPVDGADGEHQFNFNARETGLIEEIRLENLRVNPEGNPYRWDMVLMDFIAAEKDLDLYLNTCIDRVETAEGQANGKKEAKPAHITKVSGIQVTTEKRYDFTASFFADNTGDGTISMLSGCGFAEGAEPEEAYGEKIAACCEKGDVLLGTLTYNAKDMGHPVDFVPPANAFDMEKSGCLDHREIPDAMFQRFVWFYETGAGLDQAKDSEEVAAKHRELLFSIWDHIKKHPEKYGAENYDFEYISPFVGKRESRRVDGLYRLKEQDVYYQKDFEDACGYGGWAIDLHDGKGFFGTGPENWWVYLRGIYPIPLRTAIAKDADNLFVVGRCFSVTHVALGSTRLNATLATVGQAVGIAAAICKERDITPLRFGGDEIKELHLRQWRADQTVIGYRNTDAADLALSAKASVSSEKRFVMEEPEKFFPVDTVFGQSMPAKPGMKSVSFCYRWLADRGNMSGCGKAAEKTAADAVLRVSVFRSEKPQNYGPEILLKEFRLQLSPTGEGGAWFTLDLSDIAFEKEFIFFQFEPECAGTVPELAAATKRLPGVCGLMQKKNDLPNMVDYETLTPLPAEWMKLGVPLKLRKYSTASQPNVNWAFCFKTEPELSFYGGENLNNGYLRPYGQPNIWTAEGAEGEWAELRFDSGKEILEVDITFDTNLNFRVRNVKPYAFNVMEEAVRDYELWAETNGAWKKIRTVTGNHQRVNRLKFAGAVTADAVKIVIRATNGCPNAAIYNISIY
ncbi:MAG: FAD-dependent oxidoreductase [Lachnospiraceae bacterium]|nr:FAD-dependent oxidoreductase [Lachnospiraceae bacterium]